MTLTLRFLISLEIRMPNKSMDVNPTLELARRITAYNYRNGKVPPRMSQMFAIWSAEDQRREELLKVKLQISKQDGS